jgi:hypothetical protein
MLLNLVTEGFDMITFNCQSCGAHAIGSKNKKYCSDACKQRAHREVRHPFSGKMVKVKSNTQILIDCSLAVDVMKKMINISDDECWFVFIESLKTSGFRFPEDDRKSLNELQKDNLTNLINDITPANRIGDSTFIYVALFDCGAVKVGVSKNPQKRINTIAHASGRKLAEFDCVEVNRVEAFKVEADIKHSLREHLMNGEFFNCDYQLAKDKVYQYAETISFARLN